MDSPIFLSDSLISRGRGGLPDRSPEHGVTPTADPERSFPPSRSYSTSHSSIQVLSCQLEELPRPQVTASINSTTAASEHSLPPSLVSLEIMSCTGMSGILRLPTSLQRLDIQHNSGFTSLESLAGELPSLEHLYLISCSTLASLPNEPQAYVSLQDCSGIKKLIIKDCPAIKKLPRCLQQQLGSINSKYLDAQYEVSAFKPKTWKEIPRLVSERRRQAERRAEERRQAHRKIEGQARGVHIEEYHCIVN